MRGGNGSLRRGVLDTTRIAGDARTTSPATAFVRIPTRWGIYFVPEDLSTMQALLRDGALEAADLVRGHRLFKPCLRSLFMLATQEALSPGAHDAVRRLVRDLRDAPETA